MFASVGVVGVGLLGTSISLALKHKALAKQIVGVAPAEHPDAAADLRAAAARGAVDRICIGFEDDLLSELDGVVVCAPVDSIASIVERLTTAVGVHAWITDVGSTKAAIVRTVAERLPAERRYVGSHPLAGSEKRGPAAGSALLFAGKTCLVTPTAETPADLRERVAAFWRALDMNVAYKSPEEHDRIVGATSHLPHMVAAAVAACLAEKDQPFVGSGFRDTTRIAAGVPGLWTAICRHNRDALLDALAAFQSSLDVAVEALEQEDYAALENWFLDAKRRRDAVGS